jgi:hypothetical protein
MVSGVSGPSGCHVTIPAEEAGRQETKFARLQCMEEDHAKAETEMKKVAAPALDAEVLFL